MLTTTSRSTLRVGRLATVLGAAVLASSCGTDDSEPVADTPTAAPTLSIEQPWVKAADEGMTAAFGTLVNPGNEDVRVVSAESTASPEMELHEVAATDDGEMAMQPKADGFVVAAESEHVLEPGADHLMFMDLAAPVAPGDEIDITLTLEDGSTLEFVAQAKEFAGADENYQHGHDG